MECNLEQQQHKFTVKIKNIKMKYPTYPFTDHCPNWTSHILNGSLEFNDDIDLNGVQEFFDGIIKKNIKINHENCKTILMLAKLSGYDQIFEYAQAFINKNLRTIPEILDDIINEKCHNDQQIEESNNEEQIDQHALETYLSKHYNEMLQCPEILEKVEISQHFRIVQQALLYYNKNEFNYRGYISFVLNLLEKNREYMVLLSFLELDDFNIDELEKLSKCKNYDQNMLNHKIVGIITEMKENTDKINKQNERIATLEKQIVVIKEQNKQLVEQMTSNISLLLNNQQQLILQFQNESKQQFDNLKLEIKNLIANHQNMFANIIANQQQLIDESNQQNQQQFNDLKNKISDIKIINKQILNKTCEDVNLSLASFGSFNGVIRHLQYKCGGNVSDKNVIGISSSTTFNDSYLPRNAVDFDELNSFCSENKSNSWLCYDFKEKKICPNCYLIKSSNSGKGKCHLKSWVIEGSNTNLLNDWKILDVRNVISSLDDINAYKAFPIQKSDEFYQYLRIRQTDVNWHNDNYLQIGALEFFGSLQ